MEKKTSSTGKLVKHSTLYAIGTLSRQLVSFIMLPVYTNYMTPADYGVVGLLVFTLALIEPLLGARLGEAVPKFYFEQDDERDRKAVITTALMLTSGISSAVALLIFVLREPGSALLLGSTHYAPAVGIFGIQIVTQAVEYYGLSFLRMQQRPLAYISVSLSKLVVQLSLNIWLIAFLKMGVMGVVISSSASSALFAILLAGYVVRHNGCRYDAAIARRMLGFNLPLWFSGLAALYIFSANRYYIRTFSTLDQVGLYELAVRFAGVLTLLVWNPFSQFWEMERFSRHRAGADASSFGSVFSLVSTLLIIAALGISIFAKPTIELMSAKEFHAAAAAVPFLTLAMLFSCLSNFASFSLLVAEKTGVINRNSYITVAIVSVLNIALIPRFGTVGAAFALLCSLAAQFFIIHSQAKRHYDMQLHLKPLLSMIALATVGYLAATHTLAFQNIWSDIAYKLVVCGAFTLILLGMLWRNPSSRGHMEQLKNFFHKPAPQK